MKKGFEAIVWQIFTCLMTLIDRLKNNQEALETHHRGQFTLSLPAQKMQSERVLTDMLSCGVWFFETARKPAAVTIAQNWQGEEKTDLYTQQFQNITPVNRVPQFIVEVSTHLLVLIYYFSSQLMAWERILQ